MFRRNRFEQVRKFNGAQMVYRTTKKVPAPTQQPMQTESMSGGAAAIDESKAVKPVDENSPEQRAAMRKRQAAELQRRL